MTDGSSGYVETENCPRVRHGADPTEGWTTHVVTSDETHVTAVM